MTPQGFLRIDGRPARTGIYEYRRADGSTQLELRPHEEVFHPDSLASYDAAPVTIEHPVDGEVNADNVRRHEVGTVAGAARADGDSVAAEVVVKDAKAIKLIRAGKQELSPGSKIELDETPGHDQRYATPKNPTGRYDAVQRKIRVNHLAIVDRARGGAEMRLRMDAADRQDGDGKLTSIVAGHQHLVRMCGWDGMAMSSGETSCAMSEGADKGHEHPWVKAADGTVTIGMADGHTHSLLDADVYHVEPVAPRADGQFDRLGAGRESHRMDPNEQIRSLKEQLAAAEAKLTPLQTAAITSATRADTAEAGLVTLRGENENLRAQIAAAAVTVETEAVRREKIRADAAEAELLTRDSLLASRIESRVALERKAAVVMPDLNMRGIPDRQIVATIVKRLDAHQDTGPAVSDAYLTGRMDSLLELHARNARSLTTVSEIVKHQNDQRADSLETEREKQRNRWQEPFPNSRDAATARGRA